MSRLGLVCRYAIFSLSSVTRNSGRSIISYVELITDLSVIGRRQSRGVHVTSSSVAREYLFPVDIVFTRKRGVTRLRLREIVYKFMMHLYAHFVVNFMPPLQHIKLKTFCANPTNRDVITPNIDITWYNRMSDSCSSVVTPIVQFIQYKSDKVSRFRC